MALKDNLHGVTPADGVNWRYMAKGFTEASADAITVIDTSGIIDGTKNKKTILQTFLDKVGDFIINKAVTNDALMLKLADYVAKTDIVQVESTATNKVPSSAYLKQVKDSIDSNLEELSENTQAGTKTGISAKGNSVVEYDIMFDKRFPKIPEVVATLHSGTTNPNYGYLAPIVWDVTTTGFKLRIANAYSETFAPDVTWIAVVK